MIKKLPTSDQFKKAIESLGISTNDEIVLYDSQGVYSAARVWYMFNIFNKNAKVHVMNGGMIRWETEKYPIDEKPYKASTEQGSFEVNPDFSLVCTLDEMKQRVKDYKEGLTKDVNNWPKGDADDFVIKEYAFDMSSDEISWRFQLIAVIDYLKKKKIID